MNTHAKNNKIFYLIIVVALIMLAGLIANIGNVALIMCWKIYRMIVVIYLLS